MKADGATLAAAHEQSRAQGAVWLAGAPYRALAGAFAGCRDAEAIATAAEALLADVDWMANLLDPLLAALEADPWSQPPLRVARDALRTTALLHADARVMVSATVLSARAMAALPAPTSITFTGRLATVRYHRAGGARLRRWQAPRLVGDLDAAAAPAPTPLVPLDLADGMVLRLDGRCEAQLITGARADVVTLAVTARCDADACMREYALGDGTLLRAAMLEETPARTGMLLTLLRLSGRRDAGACFEAATRDGPFYLRWAAMREWLALDTAAAVPRLREMAADDNAEVRAAARATLDLIERTALCLA